MAKLKLGIIGMSEGNGHPYSWSAIFNGYNLEYMKDCPFPVIPQYLQEQKYPENFLTEKAQVTHIYTQDTQLSTHIAKASNIDNIVKSPVDMIGNIDALLLARDDAEKHCSFAERFLREGIPVYIDKPIAHSVNDADRLFKLAKEPFHVFTCSALRYAQELILSEEQKLSLGEIVAIQAYTPKSWERYAVHVIEPVLQLLGYPELSNFRLNKVGDMHRLSFVADEKELVTISNLQETKFSLCIEVIGKESSAKLEFKNTFEAFKQTLNNFILQIEKKKSIIPKTETLKVIQVIEEGLK